MSFDGQFHSLTISNSISAVTRKININVHYIMPCSSFEFFFPRKEHIVV